MGIRVAKRITYRFSSSIQKLILGLWVSFTAFFGIVTAIYIATSVRYMAKRKYERDLIHASRVKVAADVLGVKPNPAKIPEAAPLPKVEPPPKFIMPPDGVITHEANIITVEGRIGKTRQNTKGYKRLTKMRARNYRGTNRHKNNYGIS